MNVAVPVLLADVLVVVCDVVVDDVDVSPVVPSDNNGIGTAIQVSIDCCSDWIAIYASNDSTVLAM
jgi:hypothetical protein